MKKLTILCLLFYFSFSLLVGQSKWKFEPSISFGYSGEKESENPSDEYFGGGSYNSVKEKKRLPSFGAGFSVERLIKKRWGISLGAHYNYSQSFNRNEYSYYSVLDVLSSYNAIEENFIYQQIQAPLKVQFYLGKPGGIRPYLSLGGQAIYNISVSSSSQSLYTSGSEVYTYESDYTYDFNNEWNNLKRLNFFPAYSIGVAFQKFSLELNRSPILLTGNAIYPYYNSYYCDCLCDCNSYAPPVKIHSTALSIKYRL